MSTNIIGMVQQKSIEDLKKLPSVGETTAEILQEKGYGSFDRLVKASPVQLHRECDIVLSSATHIISASAEHLDGSCPRCGQSNLSNEWQEYSESLPENTTAEIICEDCGWFGDIEELE